MADRVVFGAHAVVTFVGREPGWAEVEEIVRPGEPWMLSSTSERSPTFLSAPPAPEAPERCGRTCAGRSGPAGCRFAGPTSTSSSCHGRRAAAIVARGAMSCANGFAAATASVLDCPVLTGDPEVHVAGEPGVTVRWLGPKGIALFAGPTPQAPCEAPAWGRRTDPYSDADSAPTEGRASRQPAPPPSTWHDFKSVRAGSRHPHQPPG